MQDVAASPYRQCLKHMPAANRASFKVLLYLCILQGPRRKGIREGHSLLGAHPLPPNVGLLTFFVTFLLAAVYRPILGLDFLSAHGLLVDPVGRQVLDSKSLKPLSKAKTAAEKPRSKFAAALCSIGPTVPSLIASFPAIISDGKGKPSPKHKIRHTIEMTGRPVFAKARRLDPDKLCQAEAEFRQLEAAGIIRRSELPWSLSLHMVRKKDGSLRQCSDYRRLNLATTHHRYPSILDLSNKLHGCKFFSCIDLVKGYHPIPMAAQDVAKRAIIMPFGLFEYLFMPFGLRNAAQTFQCFMDKLFKQLPFVFCYLDDLIIDSHTLEEHHVHLRQIFTILQENCLQINPAKCVFAAAVEFMGHRVETITGRETITTVVRCGEFLQTFPSTYRPHAPTHHRCTPRGTQDAGVAARRRLRGSQGRPGSCGAAGASRPERCALPGNGRLQHMRRGRASTAGWRELAAAGVLLQELSGAGTRYSTFDRELLAAFSAVRHFRFLLEG